MDWSSVLGKLLKLAVDKGNATAAVKGSGKEAPAPFSFSFTKMRREGGANPSKATPTNATAAAIGSGKEDPALFILFYKKSDEKEAQTRLKQPRRLTV